MVPGPAGVAAERNGERPATVAGPRDHPEGVPFGRYLTIVRVSDNPLNSASQMTDVLSGRSDSAAPPVLIDVRWTLAGSDRAGYLAGHIPGARFVDLDRELAGAPGAGGRHPLPEADDLQAVWRRLGIDDGMDVIVYDGGIGMAAARAWWLLRWSGITGVRVLDGGLPAWVDGAAQPTTAGPEAPPSTGTVTVRPGAMPVVDLDAAAELAGSASGLLVDARAGARFRGETEPIDPVAGHIPGSVNLPIAELLDANGAFRDPAEIRAVFGTVGLGSDTTLGTDTLGTDTAGTAAASCGSGVTACQLILAGRIAGIDLALFPGSYSQWCAAGRPVAVGGA